MKDPIAALAGALHHAFERPELLTEALTHRSFVNESDARTHNERLEFLGDAVLDLVVSEALMERFPDAREGPLSRMRSHLVSEQGLAPVAERLGIGPALRLGRGEELSGGRTKPSVLADALEAVVAAIYLDGGFQAARDAVLRWLDLPDERILAAGDAKSALQQRLQSELGATPEYRLVQQVGPDHEKTFVSEVYIRGERLAAGVGRSKKEAEQRAASRALECLDEA